METKEEGLGDWQEQILAMESLELGNFWEGNKFFLTHSQSKMLEKVLGDEFFIQDEKVRDILKDVLDCGFYYERDRKVLNLARECYLKGKNWIKKNG